MINFLAGVFCTTIAVFVAEQHALIVANALLAGANFAFAYVLE